MKVREALEQAARHLRAEQFGQAEALFRAVLSASARNVRALVGLAEVGLRVGKIPESMELLDRAIAGRPDDVEAQALWAEALFTAGKRDEAGAIFAALLATDTNCHSALRHRAIAMQLSGNFDEALPLMMRAVALAPDRFDDQLRLGKLFVVQSQPAEGATHLRRAIELLPEHVEAHLALGQALLLAGDLPRGFEQMEWRWKTPDRRYPELSRPKWEGEIEAGKSLVLVGEEGFGDVIQFAGFCPPLAAAGMDVTLMVREPLVELLSTMTGVHVIPPGGKVARIDYHLPLLSLPVALRLTLQNLQQKRPTPYLRANARLIANWRQRLGEREPGEIRIGIGWTGGQTRFHEVVRSIPLSSLAPLVSSRPRVRLHSLHVTPESRQEIARCAASGDLRVADHAAHLKNFADTAALMTNLDLIITIDTSLAHLAGALGLPTWILLVHPPDGRWMLGRRDTPWYPSARLFRQLRVGDWSSVVEEVVQTLHEVDALH